MLRLASLSPPRSAPSSSPIRALAAQHHHHHTATSPSLATHTHGRMWVPGSPIVFGGPAQQAQAQEHRQEGQGRSATAGRAWRAGDAVLFGPAEGGARGGAAQQEARGALQLGVLRCVLWLSSCDAAGLHRPPPPSPDDDERQLTLRCSSSPAQTRPALLDSHARPAPAPAPARTPSPRPAAAAWSPRRALSAAPPPPSLAAHTARADVPHGSAPRALSQAEMDDLVAGVDWEGLDLDLELVEPDLEREVERSPPALAKQPSLAPDELERLVDGIDFSQDGDLLLSDVDEPAPVGASASTSSASPAETSRTAHLPSPSPDCAAPRASPSPRLGFRTATRTRALTLTPAPAPASAPTSPSPSPSPRPEPPQHARDLFSPRTAGGPGPKPRAPRASSPFRPAFGAPPVGSPQARSIRAYSSSPGSPGAPRAAPTSTSCAGGGASAATPRVNVKVIELLSDDSDAPGSSPDLVVVRNVRSVRRAASAAPTAAAAAAAAGPHAGLNPKGGWFQRPAARPAVPPASAYSTSSTASRAPTASTSTSSTSSSSAPARPRPVLAPGVPSRAAPPLRPTAAARTGALRAPRQGSKRQREADKQDVLRALWDKTFSFKTWPVGAGGGAGARPRMVYTTDEREVERVLPTLEGCVVLLSVLPSLSFAFSVALLLVLTRRPVLTL